MEKKRGIVVVVLIVIVIAAAIAVLGAHHKGSVATPTQASPTMVATTSVPTSSNAAAPATSSSPENPGVSISIQRSYAGASFSFNYPASWSILAAAPFSLINFDEKNFAAGVLPPGGAEIDIATTTLYGNLDAITGTELMGATFLSTSTVTVGGTSCMEARYHETYAGGVQMANTALYCGHGTELWKIYLVYRVDDQAAAIHLADFESVLRSMRFSP